MYKSLKFLQRINLYLNIDFLKKDLIFEHFFTLKDTSMLNPHQLLSDKKPIAALGVSFVDMTILPMQRHQ